MQGGGAPVALETSAEYHELSGRPVHGEGRVRSGRRPPARQGARLEGGSERGADGDQPMPGDDQLIRDARYTSGFTGVFKHGQKWVAKVMRDGALALSVGNSRVSRRTWPRKLPW